MTKMIIVEIAQRLKAARKAAGYKSAKDFAKVHAIPLSTYSQHETGKRSIHAELLIDYSLKLNLNPHWLFTGEGEPTVNIKKQKLSGTKNQKLPDTEKIAPKKLLENHTNRFKLIDTELLKKVLFAVESLIMDRSIKLTYCELIDYCFDVYDIVSALTVQNVEKEKIINLTISSLRRGAITDLKSQKG